MADLTWNAMALWRTGSSWTPTLGRQYLPAPRLQWGLYGSGSNTWRGWRGERLAGRDTDGSGQLQANRTTVDSGVTGNGGVMGLMLFVPGIPEDVD